MGAPAVLVLDDGELDDVQQLLQEMAIPFARIRGGAIVQGSEPPRDLLIATPRRIDAVRDAVGEAIDGPVRVMVVNEDSNALRSQLRRSGFDYLVRRPVHAEALRLMLLHCCYKGEERRREPRVPVGVEVSYQRGSGRAPRDARRPVEPRLPAAVAPPRRARQAHQGADSRGARRGRGRRAARRARRA